MAFITQTSLPSTLSGGTVKSFYGEVTGVVSGVLTTLISYTAIEGSKLQLASFAGTNIAEYEVLIDATVIDKRYTNFGANPNEDSYFGNGLPLTVGQVVRVKVLHNRPYPGDFNARVQIVEP